MSFLLASFAQPGWRESVRCLDGGGNAWGILRGESPEIARAEEEARAELAWELIYNSGTTLKGSYPPKLGLGPLTLLSLDSPSLSPPCYSGVVVLVGVLVWQEVGTVWLHCWEVKWQLFDLYQSCGEQEHQNQHWELVQRWHSQEWVGIWCLT